MIRVTGLFDGDPAALYFDPDDDSLSGDDGPWAYVTRLVTMGRTIAVTPEGPDVTATLSAGDMLATLATMREAFDPPRDIGIEAPPGLIAAFNEWTADPMDARIAPDDLLMSEFKEWQHRRDRYGRFARKDVAESPALLPRTTAAALGIPPMRLTDAHPDILAAQTAPDVAATLVRLVPSLQDVNFDGFDIDTAREVSAEFVRLAKDFPEATAGIRYIGAPDWVDDAASQEAMDDLRGGGMNRPWAIANVMENGTGYIALNPYHFIKDRDVFAAQTLEASRTGWHVAGADTPATVMTHEFGHHVDWWLERTFNRPGGEEDIARLTHARSEWQRWTYNDPVSDYASVDVMEAAAEVFTMLRYGNPSSFHVRQMRDLIERARRTT